jgi:hypothetical protein
MTLSPTKPDDEQERRERAVSYIMRRDHVSREVAAKIMQGLNGPQLWMLEQELKPRVPMFVADYDPFGRT